MPLILRKNIMCAELILWRMAETEEELASLVLAGDAVSAAGFASTGRRIERLAWRAALRAAGVVAGVAYSDTGSPFLEDSDRYISVSHCAGLVCVALSNVRCGVDIEPADRDCSSAAHRFISDAERSFLAGAGPNPEAVAWCSKEALYKYAGREGVDFIRDIRLTGISGDTLQASVGSEPAAVRILREEGCILAFAHGIRTL